MINDITIQTHKLQTELINKLIQENERLRKQLKLEQEDNRFLLNVAASALANKDTHATVYREYDEPKFDLKENLSGDMLIVLRSIT